LGQVLKRALGIAVERPHATDVCHDLTYLASLFLSNEMPKLRPRAMADTMAAALVLGVAHTLAMDELTEEQREEVWYKTVEMMRQAAKQSGSSSEQSFGTRSDP
jgi:hypothetical protein